MSLQEDKAVKPSPHQKLKIIDDEIPEGHAVCYVAIPGKVSRGGGTLERCQPGERIIGPKKTIEELQLRGHAFFDEAEAKAAHNAHRRKIDAKRNEAVAAMEAKQKRIEAASLSRFGHQSE